MPNNDSLYDPFSVGPEFDHTHNRIKEEKKYSGQCKGVLISQNSMMSVAEKGTYKISIPDNEVDVDVRDTIYFWSNGTGTKRIMTVTETKRYERNTIIFAMHIKDGTSS